MLSRPVVYISRLGHSPAVGSSLLVDLPDHRSLQDRMKSRETARETEKKYRSLRSGDAVSAKLQGLFHCISEGGGYGGHSIVKEGARKLVVFIHGLRSSPLAWGGYLQEISRQDPTISCFVPEVWKRGNCKLQHAAFPILDFLQRQPLDCPIDLVGHSRGAVIAGFVMRKLSTKTVRLISIAGPHGGSKVMTTIYRSGMHNALELDPELVTEGVYLGDFARKELQQWQKIQTVGEKFFYASAEDVRILPSSTCFPNLPNSTYALIAKESHSGILEGVMPDVLPLLVQ